MAYKQTPGRGNGTKTGAGISPTLMSGSPMKQTDPKKMTLRELSIERGAKNDSIEASNKAGDVFTKRQKAAIGNKAANITRKINDAPTTVVKTQVEGKKGFEDKYTRTPAKQMTKKSPMKQVDKMASKQVPMKQVSKMPMKQMKKKSC